MSFSDLSEISDADFKDLALHELSEVTVTSTDKRAETLPKHPEFYVTDLITLKVENTLFRVERHLLEASNLSTFRAVVKKDEQLDSSEDECITISNVTVLQMESFLECLYYPLIQKFSMPMPRAVAALKVLKMLGFEEHYDFLLELLESSLESGRFTPQSRIFYARQCRMKEWLTRAYVEIVCRENGLSKEEAKELGLEKTLALCHVREKISALRASKTKANASGESVVQDLTKEAEELVKTETSLNQEEFGPAQSSSVCRAARNDERQGQRHPVFYFTDEFHLITLNIQGVLFRTPLRMMRGAKILDEGIAAIPSGNPLSTDESPLELDCKPLQAQEFQSFLRVVTATQPEPVEDQLGLTEWARALRVATLIEHDAARKFIITAIERSLKTENPIDLIEIANEFNLEHWLPAQYERLAKRSKKLTEAEMRRLGYRASSEVASKRELEAFRRGEQQGASNAAAGTSLQRGIITNTPVQNLFKSSSRASRALR